MQNIAKHLSLYLALFTSVALHAQSNSNTRSEMTTSGTVTEKASGQVFVAAKKDDLPNDPYRSAVFIAAVSGSVQLTLNIPLWHSVKQPYVTIENLTKGTYLRYTTFPGESTYRTTSYTLIAGDQYRLTANIYPNPSDPNDDTDEDVLATLSW
ncbi:hypothetical protein ACTJJ0_05280 [Chitinophaga sp. 22321]|uniref:DUF2846 domain-containing protein n=1 Tax=Chitinophaga hostae TaxID=2831022 RepID=A0ABS5J1L8_9BACT|nr:hypothetical protein [Chitinophaga hostae]MBS0028332.1 hypothetical protein [Chitinophaga hostae]